MAASADRLRRVLSDGALPVGAPPLARVPLTRGPQSGALNPEREAQRELLREKLRQRLASLHVAAPRAPAVALEPPPAPPPAEDRRPLEALVGGRIEQGPRGSYLRVERRYPLESLHGRVVLAEALAHPVRLRNRDRGPDGARTLDLAEAVFLDTETTGLSGGTGTVAFLVGTGRVVGDEFVVRQLALRDYPEEGAVLEALAEELADRPLVSFNGRAFDWPLLVTRFSLQRLKLRERAHLDLLPQARRLWSGSLPSHALSMLERHVLGLTRADDLPGAEVPAAWFRYLRTGEGGLVARAFQHNETDVVSMLALLARIGAVLDGATASLIASPRDHLGTARLLLEHGEPERARRCLEAGLALAQGADAGPLLHLKAHLARRAGEHEAALDAWRAAIALAPERDLTAHVEAAKLLEHRLGRLEEALALTQAALARLGPSGPAHDELARRQSRLKRRLDA